MHWSRRHSRGRRRGGREGVLLESEGCGRGGQGQRGILWGSVLGHGGEGCKMVEGAGRTRTEPAPLLSLGSSE